jgi:hypothetical protein
MISVIYAEQDINVPLSASFLIVTTIPDNSVSFLLVIEVAVRFVQRQAC